VKEKLVFFGEHHKPVEREKAPKLGGVKHVDALKLAFCADDLPVHPDGQPHVGRVHFGKPEFHVVHLTKLR
jgi:hypothetical protein